MDENEVENGNDDDEEITCGADDLESGSQQMPQVKASSFFNRPPLSIIVSRILFDYFNI